MNCKTCKKLSKTMIVGKAIKDEPYKYKCKANKFSSIPATNKLGKSFNDGEYEHYTKSQLDYFISSNSRNLCFARFNITNSNIISSAALFLSLLSIFINFNTNKNDIKTLKDKIIADSVLFENRIRIMKDSIDLLEANVYTNKKNVDKKLQGITKNIVHLADSANNEYDSNN